MAATMKAEVPTLRSWAAIVKGTDEAVSGLEPVELAALAPEPVEPSSTKPRAASSRTRLGACRGQVLTMLSYYGWIMPLQDIDHPDKDNHEGHIYVKKSDVKCGSELKPGDVVTFNLYSDNRGLGAEACRLQSAGGAGSFSFNASALEFVPMTFWQDDGLLGYKGDDVAEAETDLSSIDGDGASEDLTSDSDTDSGAHGFGAPGGKAPGWRGFPLAPQMINLDNYDDCSDCSSDDEGDTVVTTGASSQPLLTYYRKDDGSLALAPWRVLAPPGLPEPPTEWPPAGDTAWLSDLPWRRTT